MIELFDFQKKILDDTQEFNRCAYYLDMGLGKTFVGSEKLINLRKGVNLIVCQKSKVKDWTEHFQTNYLLPVHDLTVKAEFEEFVEMIKTGHSIIGVINYDLLIRRPELKKLKDFALMLDESQAIQNETAKRTKYIMKMNPSAVILLSGTPVNGKYEQLYSQCQLLGWNISKKDFWDRYIVYRLWRPVPMMPPIKLVSGYKNVEELKRNLRNYGAVFLKTDEVMTLPDQLFCTVNVSTSPQYRQFMKNRIVNVDGEWKSYVDECGHDIEYYTGKTLVGDTLLTKLLYARQLCSIYNKDKLGAFKDWIESTNERLIVFYNFTEELNRMLTVIGDRPVSIVNGEQRDLTAYENEPNSITFLQIQSGNSGLNLQKANHMAFFSLPLSCNMFEQAKKRIHRIGQKQTCFYYYFMCMDSVEEDILAALKRGKDYTDKLFTECEK